jgi:hypothetical protein
LVHIVFVWYIFSKFGILYLEKSGNPGRKYKSDQIANASKISLMLQRLNVTR